MILTELKAYADNRMNLPPPMYGEVKVAWYINLSAAGRYESWTCLKKPKHKAFKRGQSMMAPHIGRTAAVKPKLLVDTGEYVLGLARRTSKPERVAECHQQFKALVKTCAVQSKEPSVATISAFLTGPELQCAIANKPPEFDPSEVVTFRVDGVIPASAAAGLSAIEQFWADYTAGESHCAAQATPMTCLVTGNVGPVEQRLPFLIKGLIGGQPAGTALVSANAAAFSSYGLKNSLTSPISRDAAESFSKALNHLLANKQSRLDVGSTAYVFWTKAAEHFNPFVYLAQPTQDMIAEWLNTSNTSNASNASNASLITPQTLEMETLEMEKNETDPANPLYMVALSANNARSVIRDWLATTVFSVQHNLKIWFEGQRLVDAAGQPGKPFGLYALAASVYRDPKKEMMPAMSTALMRSALHGDRLPEDLLVRLVHRNRIERTVTYPRAVLTKLIFTLDERRKPMIADMEQLNLDPDLQGEDKAAYYCGRLLAALEAVQRAALGPLHMSLSDRYYGVASSTPANAFPPLMRGARTHLAQLRRTSPGAYQALEEALEEIKQNILPPFPKTLSIQQQGIFSLGYYHQRAANRAAAKAASKQKASP